MGLISKALVYGGFFALGFGMCYSSCVNNNYRIVEEDGRVYVEDKNTGKKGVVEGNFDLESAQHERKRLTSEEIGHDLKRRVGDAYRELTR
jgi:hypothetical protein